jgi:hypothetical protein
MDTRHAITIPILDIPERQKAPQLSKIAERGGPRSPKRRAKIAEEARGDRQKGSSDAGRIATRR